MEVRVDVREHACAHVEARAYVRVEACAHLKVHADSAKEKALVHRSAWA